MEILTIDRAAKVNANLLNKQVKEFLGQNLVGINVIPNFVEIILNEPLETPEDEDAIRAIVSAHNGNEKTETQIRLEQARTEVNNTKEVARQVLEDYDQTIADATANWGSMTATQKVDALANVVLKTSEIVRFLGYAAYAEME